MLPLVGVACVVGIAATLVAVALMSGLTDQWVASRAEAIDLSTRARLTEASRDLRESVRLMSQDPRLEDWLGRSDEAAAASVLTEMNRAIRADSVLLLDRDGSVVAATGAAPAVAAGDRPLGAFFDATTTPEPSATFVRIGDRDTIAAARVLRSTAGTYTLCVVRLLDSELLGERTRGSAGSFALYDDDGRLVAMANEPGDAVSEAAFEAPAPPVSQALAAAAAGEVGLGSLESTSGAYHVRSSQVTLPSDPVASRRYLVTLMRTDVIDATRVATIRLIALLSIFAVLLLWGLGAWIARSVSTPLLTLSEGARRIADGDFTTKVRIGGANEIHALAESFNSMTDSLRDRTESLTRKVLELATLYEISRSLGATLDLDELLRGVLDSALRIFEVETGYISLRDRNDGSLAVRIVTGGGQLEPDDRAVRSSMAEWVAREGRPLIFNPSGDAHAASQVDTVTGASAALSVPLSTNEGVIGAITVGTRDASFRFSADDVRLLSTVANHVAIAIGNIELFVSLQDAYLATVRALAAAVDAKDTYTRGHSDGVAAYSVATGSVLGLSPEQMTALEMAAYLHDIGKIGVREEILLKPGRLTDAEMGQMRHHPLIGANILRPVAFPWPIAPVVRHHHEHWDGRGYPAGLKGEEIPLLARVLGVADAYEAMTSDRPYRRGRSRDEAVAELRRCAGTQFDPRIVDAFVAGLERLGPGHEQPAEPSADLMPEEARAVFVGIADGMLDSYRRLGGPRLAANLEAEMNAYFEPGDLPFRVAGGHLVIAFEYGDEPERELEAMRHALKRLMLAMEGTSGHSLVDHFYAEALSGLSDRMRSTAARMDLRVV
ncbi:MAG: HD domain-containing protein [Actinobacteria bacterium]|nr:MAG: HD domain-containing protein [Actinomycetota bacterium]